MQLPGTTRKPTIPTQRNTAETATVTAHAEATRSGGNERASAGGISPTALAEGRRSTEAVFQDIPTARTAVVERPASPRISESGLNLANPDKVNFHNALNLARVSKDSYTEYNHSVGHTQFLHREYSDHQVLAFSGSKELKDWGHDANFKQMKYKKMGWVHSGFAKAYEEILPLQDTVLAKDKPLIITGHSLGGATATVAALDLKQRGYDVHSVYTYGSPRVGYSDFKDTYTQAGIPTYRFVNAWDVVPRVPKAYYHHVGEAFFLTSDGKVQDRQETAWKLWPWDVPGKRITSHYMPAYVDSLQKYLS